MDDRALATFIKEIGGSAVADSVFSEALEITRITGREAGRQEAYEQFTQANDATVGQREQELAHRCQVLLAQMERLIRVNRYLFSLMDDARDEQRAHNDPMAVFSQCPRTCKPEKPLKGNEFHRRR